MKQRFKIAADFLANGRMGGMLLEIILVSMFINGAVLGSLFRKEFIVISFIIAALLCILLIEILLILLKVFLGHMSRSRIYFLVSWLILSADNIIATQGKCLVPSIMMCFFLTITADLFGRVIWAFVKTRNWKYIPGYIIAGISLMYLAFFSCFYLLDCWGESRLDFYLSAEDTSISTDAQVVSGFNEYISDGKYTVGTLTYGPSAMDIDTEPVNLKYYEKRTSLYKRFMDFVSDYSVETAPVTGVIWYPEEKTECPVFFMVHGAHDADTPSFMGYEYLGRYLASNGYVVVSVDENIVNELGCGNNIRAVLLLENMKSILNENNDSNSLLYNKIDSEKIAIGGHSRGGEMVATAYLFNDLDMYPDNGNIEFDYHFNISSIVAIAPTVDQYIPSGHSVAIQDVDYLLIHGTNDQDVTSMMGEKQYNNVSFSKRRDRIYCKASVYIMGANHGQFNSKWGRYDLTPGLNGYLNTNNFISKNDQELIAKAYIRIFLDRSLNGNMTYVDLLEDVRIYKDVLPKTVYVTNYMDSDYDRICDFDDSVDLYDGYAKGTQIQCEGMSLWHMQKEAYGNGQEEENYALKCMWEDADCPRVDIDLVSFDMTKCAVSFRMCDNRDDISDVSQGLQYTVEVTDVEGNKAIVKKLPYIYPTFAMQLYKQDVFFNTYEYKHQMQTVRIDKDMFDGNVDFEHIDKMSLIFDGSEEGSILIDDICVIKR